MKSMFSKKNKGSTHRPAKFIAPGELAKEFGQGQRGSKSIRETSENVGVSNNIDGTNKKLQTEESQSHYIINRRIVGGILSHTLTLHFGDNKCKEHDFTEDSSFLDIMNMCRKFINIYSDRFIVTDGDGRQLKNDRDLLYMLEEHHCVENIDIYLELDEKGQPLLFKMPQDISSIAPIPNVPKSGGVVNGNSVETRYHKTNKSIQAEPPPQEPRNTRGKNKNKKIACLKSTEKVEIQFFNNRAVGKNHSYWSRHLGKIVRCNNTCPVRVKTWKDITESSRQHMWDCVKECFSNPNIELYREHTLDHMGALWTAWRSSLNAMYVKSCKTRAEVLKNVPEEMNSADWEWLVTNKFLTNEFQKLSNQNSNNRVNGVMPHRSGSKPHRQLMFEKGAKEGSKDDSPMVVANIFFETRKKNGKLDAQSQKKYDEIIEIAKSNPSTSHIELVERSFGPQRHSHVFGYGGGMKRKDFNDFLNAYIKQLEAKLCEKDEENSKLKRRMDMIESRLANIEDNHSNSNTSTSPEELETP